MAEPHSGLYSHGGLMSRNSTGAAFQGPPTLVRLFPHGHGEVVVPGGPRAAPLLSYLQEWRRLNAANPDLLERIMGVFASGRRVSCRQSLSVDPEQRVYDVELWPELGQECGASVASVLGIFHDVTDEVRAGEGPYQLRQRFELMLSHMPGFCYTVDRNLVFTSSVGAGLAVLNLQPYQVVGMTLLELWGTSDPDYEPLRCHLAALDGEVANYKDVCLGRSLEYQVCPLRDTQGNVVGAIGVGIDVTEREAAKEQQTKLTERLRQAGKIEAIGRLAGGVAHDFNNLLTCIMGNLTIAERQLEIDPAAARRHLAEANNAVDSSAALTRQLLAFGRRQIIDPHTINLSSLVARVEGMLRRLIGESIALRTRYATDLWNIEADAAQIEQVLVNLVVNARDAITAHGEILVETSNLDVTERTLDVPGTVARGQYVVLSVSDNGRGMSDVVRERLFEPFFTTKQIGDGTGLGLATVYAAVEQSGGVVIVDSELGQGATFKVFLPRSHAQLDSEARLMARTEEGAPGGTERILVVEDEPLVLELAHYTLQQLGYQVLPCAGSDEALRTIADQHQPVDLLITDVVMPRMNGKELAARVRAFQPRISVLFSSGYGEGIMAQPDGLDHGVNFIEKPYRPIELARKVRSVLDAARFEADSGLRGKLLIDVPEPTGAAG